MSIRKHSEAQIIEALKSVEAGRTATDVGRELGVSKRVARRWAQLALLCGSSSESDEGK